MSEKEDNDIFMRPWNYDPFFHSSVSDVTEADERDLEHMGRKCERCGTEESAKWFIENRITNGLTGDYRLVCMSCSGVAPA